MTNCAYVPIRETYGEPETCKWFESAGMTEIARLESTWGPYGGGKWTKGEGYLKFAAKKALARRKRRGPVGQRVP